MGKPKRLPPQPVDTALARLVQRMVNMLPGATIGTREKLKDIIQRLQRQLARADDDNRRLNDALRQMQRDFRRLMAPVPRPVGRGKISVGDQAWAVAPELRFSVTYQPMSFSMLLAPKEFARVSRGEISGHTLHALRDAARQIAQEQAAHHEAEILNHTLKALTKEDSHV